MEADTLLRPGAVKEKIKVVDADTHFSEPYDLWTSRVPASFKDKVPHVRLNADGVRTWYYDTDKVLQPAGSSCVIGHDNKKKSFWEWDIRQNSLPFEQASPAAYNVKERLKLMDEEGVTAQIVYGNLTGFGAHKLAHWDPEVAKITVQTFNDAVAEFQQESDNRCFPQALIPFWDIKFAVKELERCARDLKLTGITITPEPHANPDLPPLSDRHWDPLWQACSDLEMPINFHVGASEFSFSSFADGCWPGLDEHRSLVVGCSLLEMHNARVLSNLLTCDVLPRFPKTKWVFVESGLCWIPYIIERLEWQLLDTPFRGKGAEQPGPRELFQRQVYSCFWFENAAPSRLLDIIGVDNVLFETDFPHPTCQFPGGVDLAMKSLEPWSDEIKRKVMGENAIKLYNLPI